MAFSLDKAEQGHQQHFPFSQSSGAEAALFNAFENAGEGNLSSMAHEWCRWDYRLRI